MTVTIDFTPLEEAWLNAQTQRQGLSPAEVIKNLVDQHMPDLKDPLPVPEETAPVISAKSADAIAFLKRKLEEEATDDPEKIRMAEEDLAQFKRNINANRKATGDRIVYP